MLDAYPFAIEGYFSCPKCGSKTITTSGGNAGTVYCGSSCKRITECDGVKRA